jgi:hypothetical protein
VKYLVTHLEYFHPGMVFDALYEPFPVDGQDDPVVSPE